MAANNYIFIFLFLSFSSIESESVKVASLPSWYLPEVTDWTVTIDPVVFSPNSDGINDQLNIYLITGEAGCLLNITILNCSGRVIRKLANNFTAGSSAKIVWDGLNADLQMVQPGIYIVDISIFAQTGKRKSFRFACVLTDRP